MNQNITQAKAQRLQDIASAKASHERQARREQRRINHEDVKFLQAALEAPDVETFLRIV